MKEFNHTIYKKNEDCELFEDIFELEISTNIKEYVIQKEGLKVTGNYFKSDVPMFGYTEVLELYDKITEFNVLSKNKSCYLMEQSDSEYDGDRIISSSFCIGVYDKNKENNLFEYKELSKIICYGQNCAVTETFFDMWFQKKQRKIKLSKLLNTNLKIST